jgi:hypothetical protein
MDKAEVVFIVVFKPCRNTTEVLQPGEESLDFPATAVTPQRPPVLSYGLLPVAAMWRNHLDACSGQLGVERVGVIGFIADQSLGQFGGKNFGESACNKGDLMRRSRRRVDGERKTRAVCHRQELRTFAPLGLSHPEAPFLATTNVPSMKHSDRSRSPRSLRSAARASRARRRVPSPTHCWNRRWQVWYAGNLSGRSCHLAPERRIQRMPFRTSRVSFHGLPRPSSRRGGVGISGSIIAHCSSVISSRLAISADFSRTRYL